LAEEGGGRGCGPGSGERLKKKKKRKKAAKKIVGKRGGASDFHGSKNFLWRVMKLEKTGGGGEKFPRATSWKTTKKNHNDREKPPVGKNFQ